MANKFALKVIKSYFDPYQRAAPQMGSHISVYIEAWGSDSYRHCCCLGIAPSAQLLKKSIGDGGRSLVFEQ